MLEAKRFLFVITLITNLIGSYIIGFLGLAQWDALIQSYSSGSFVTMFSGLVWYFILGIRFLIFFSLLWAVQDNLLKAFETRHIKYPIYAAIFLLLPFLARFFPYSNLQDNFMISLVLLVWSLPIVLLHYRLRQAARSSDEKAFRATLWESSQY